MVHKITDAPSHMNMYKLSKNMNLSAIHISVNVILHKSFHNVFQIDHNK